MELKSVISLFLFLCLLGHLECTDQKEIKVKGGENATLECSGPTDATLVMIRWEKSEDIVILFRDGRFQENLQHELFKGRVKMKDPKWKETGDLSVILKHVTMNDAGTYECKAGYDGQKPLSLNRVTLKVENSDVSYEKELKVKGGEDATLECSGPTDATLIMMRWEKSDLQSEDIVILFRDGRFQENLQNELFKGRVKMKDPKWKETGDFSVILKHVTTDDAGTYECKAAYDGQKPRSLNRVTLKVEKSDQKELKVKGGEDVTLECSGPTDASLIMMRWEKSDPQSEDFVILFRDGRFQENLQHELFKGRVSMKDAKWKETGDFSVILKHVTMNDAGTYECKAAYDGQKPRSLNRVTLKVENSGHTGGQKKDEDNKDEGKKDGSVVLGIGLSVVAVVFSAVVFLYIYRKHIQSNKDSHHPPAEQQIKMSERFLNSPAANYNDRNELEANNCHEQSTRIPDVTLTLENELLHPPPQETAGLLPERNIRVRQEETQRMEGRRMKERRVDLLD